MNTADLSFSWDSREYLADLIDGTTEDDFIITSSQPWKLYDGAISPRSGNQDNIFNQGWEGTFAPIQSYEHLLPTDIDADEEYAHYIQSQLFSDFGNFAISPPEKDYSLKKRVSPSKDINYKRSRTIDYSPRSSWSTRPDHLDILGTSSGSNNLFPSSLTNPLPSPPLGITIPTLPNNDETQSSSKNEKTKIVEKKTPTTKKTRKPRSSTKNNSKKRRNRKNDSEIVITLNKTECDEDTLVDIDDDDLDDLSLMLSFEDDDDSSSKKNVEDKCNGKDKDNNNNNSNSNNNSNNDVNDLESLLISLGFKGQKWLEEVEIPPTKCFDMKEDEILDFEKEANSEFFEGNNVKTPERYLRIRNYILQQWTSNKAKYVTKTSVRRGLKDCGDVNAIGRVHQFLELIGAINFGLEAPPSCRKQGQPEPVSVLIKKNAKFHS